MRRILASDYFLWAVLALPAIPMTAALSGGAPAEDLLHPSGEFAARFLIVALMATPLALLFGRDKGWTRYLLKHRRHLGVAAFAYTALHTLLYLQTGPWSFILEDLENAAIWTGWVAAIAMLFPALTSNDWSVRALRAAWKTVQRLAYPAAIFTLLHWALLHEGAGLAAALVHFVPLIALEAYRVRRHLQRRRAQVEKPSVG